jgi:hypothetical protein
MWSSFSSTLFFPEIRRVAASAVGRDLEEEKWHDEKQGYSSDDGVRRAQAALLEIVL